MNQIIVPVLLFIISAVLTFTVLESALVFIVLGAVITIIAIIRNLHKPKTEKIKGGSATLLRSGLALMLAPIITAVFVLARMFGWFGL